MGRSTRSGSDRFRAADHADPLPQALGMTGHRDGFAMGRFLLLGAGFCVAG